MMAGRPTKRTQEVEKKICDALRAGNTRRAACQYAGIGETTLARWLADFGDFGDALTRAEAECEVHDVATVKRASGGYETGERTETTETRIRKKKTTTINPKTGAKVVTEEDIPYQHTRIVVVTRREFDWRAAAWRLERRHRKDWGRRDTLDLGNANGKPFLVASEDELLKKIYGREGDEN